MMNIRKLGSKKVLGLNSKTVHPRRLFLGSGLKATGISAILLRQNGFENDCSETKF